MIYIVYSRSVSVNERQSPAGADGGDCTCKVGRGIERYGLASFDETLAERWCGIGCERQSLRQLSTEYNHELLEAAVQAAGETPIDGEIENLYELLTDDDVSSGVRTQTRRRLENSGVSVDAVEELFVSHQTIHSHLTECLGVERSDSETQPSERRRSDRDRIRALQSRTEAVTTDALDRLVESDALELNEFDVFVDVTVLCDECGAQQDVGTLLDRGGCDCMEPI